MVMITSYDHEVLLTRTRAGRKTNATEKKRTVERAMAAHKVSAANSFGCRVAVEGNRVVP